MVGPQHRCGVYQINKTGNHEIGRSAAMTAAQISKSTHRFDWMQLKPDFFTGLAASSIARFKIAVLAPASRKGHLP